MPPMPAGDPWPAIGAVLEAEFNVRCRNSIDAGNLGLNAYWADLVRIIEIYFAEKGDPKIEEIAEQITFKKFKPYIASRMKTERG